MTDLLAKARTDRAQTVERPAGPPAAGGTAHVSKEPAGGSGPAVPCRSAG